MPTGIAKNTLKVSHFFDQGCRLEVKPIEKELLKYQASVMKRDPDYVRRQNPPLAAATDAAIVAAAEAMEAGYASHDFVEGLWWAYQAA